ncbi:MAG: hypothetical protein ACTSR2_06300 [Candidatus Hodarchaeales archaeon]
MTLDLKGTVGRYLFAVVKVGLGIEDISEVNAVMYDPFEKAMLSGEAYNFLDFGAYFK